MICPHCGVGVNINWEEVCYAVPNKSDDYEDGYGLISGFCPECNKYIAYIEHGQEFVTNAYDGSGFLKTIDLKEQIYPKFICKKILDSIVPQKYCDLFREAEAVLELSPRASATLSRYLLQMLLHEELKIKKKNLEEEIKELEEKTNIPSTLVIMLQVMRRIANFGAHPKKSMNSNEIIDVESGEADIMLDLINELFDYLFIKPKKQQDFLSAIKEKYSIDLDKDKCS